MRRPLPKRNRPVRVGPLAALAISLASCSATDAGDAASTKAEPRGRAELAIMTSLPIMWAEGDIGDMLSGDPPQHWVRDTLEVDYRPVPIDRLTQLPGKSLLLLAQPRPLAADENVALDEWVRSGGRVLLMADPMLTAHSEYALGDARAPQPVALLSPILGRWGLEMAFDPAQSPDAHFSGGELAIPVRMAGELRQTGTGFESDCNISENALVADCRVGKGRALIVADAAIVEDGEHAGEPTRTAFMRLLDHAFGD